MQGIYIDIRETSFDVAELEAHLSLDANMGAVVSFVGRVRAYGDQPDVVGLHLEHYPAMTHKVLWQHAEQAMQRWSLGSVVLIHRVGSLSLGEPIVGVAVSSGHRKDAFEATQFLMDFLKYNAPFWKQELTKSGQLIWVEQKQTDVDCSQQW